MYVFKRLSNRKKEMEEEKREQEKTRQGEEEGDRDRIFHLLDQSPKACNRQS